MAILIPCGGVGIQRVVVCSWWGVRFSELRKLCGVLLALDCQRLGEILGRMADNLYSISSLIIHHVAWKTLEIKCFCITF